MKLAKALACVIFVAVSLAGARHATRTIAIYADALLDTRQGRTVRDAIVVVSDDRIAYAGSKSDFRAPVPAGAERIELRKVTLLPGLVDAHVHLTLGGSPASNARATVEAGFTTVQDLGATDAQVFALRDDINAGRTVGPRVLASGRWIGVTNGTCDFGGIGVRGAAAFRERVQEEVRRGADVIKVCVSGWLDDARRNPDRYEISDDELEAAIDEAHRLERRLAVHAISARGIDAAVRMGADLIVHAGFVEAKTLERMRARSIYLLPTLFSFSRTQPQEDVLALFAHLRDAIRAGLPVAFGTDAGVIAHGRNAREFESLRELGLEPLEAIRMATVHAASAVGLTDSIGMLEAGASADMIAVDGDPLQDLAALQRVVFVMSRGVIIKRPSAR